MSRSGYGEDDNCDEYPLALWRGAVQSAINGKRGQAMLSDLVVALDAMPVKELIAESLVTAEGAFCTLGALGHVRGVNMTLIDPEDWDAVARAFNLAPAAVREIVYINDEHGAYDETPEGRWHRMRSWAICNLKKGVAA